MGRYPCPICSLPEEADIFGLLSGVGDPAVLVTFALDVAERVADLTVCPRKVHLWLSGAREWETRPQAAEAAQAAIDASCIAMTAEEEIEDTEDLAARAVWEAIWSPPIHVKDKDGESTLAAKAAYSAIQASWAAEWAEEAAGSDSSERQWQLVHLRELACTCSAVLDIHASSPRSRISLLAD